ncbi:MAG TPA: protein-L-isoaspartate O-methyltransferase [Rhizobiaceae bacterium]|nr:protein-L-isoaspartate O-methyltransferase [Rhizobiaceae bacterium]
MSADFSKQRAKMVDGQLRTTDVTDNVLLSVMGIVPRELFVPEVLRPLAYIDEDLEITPADDRGPARYLMEPSPFARLVQLATVRDSDRILDVGCGTGYSSAVFSRLGSAVVALESDPELAARARSNFSILGAASVTLVEGPLREGYAKGAPYDVIFVNGAVDDVPDTLCAQLAEGGRLVAVVGHGNAAAARLYVKEQGDVTGRRVFNAAVKSLPGFEKEAVFEF